MVTEPISPSPFPPAGGLGWRPSRSRRAQVDAVQLADLAAQGDVGVDMKPGHTLSVRDPMNWSASHPEFARCINDVRFTRLTRGFVYMLADFMVKGLKVALTGPRNSIGIPGHGARGFRFVFATVDAVWPDEVAWPQVPPLVELRLELWAPGVPVMHAIETRILRALLIVGEHHGDILDGEEQARPRASSSGRGQRNDP